jgi:flagellar biosynthesis protein FlhF
MIKETFVATTPKEAYENAVAKYGTSDLDIISAKQILIDDKPYSELVIAVPKDIFMQYSFISKDKVITQEEQLQAEIDELKEEILKFTQEIKQPKNIVQSTKVSKTTKDKIRELFISKGLAPQWLDKVLDEIGQNAIIDDKELLVSYIFEEIDEGLRVADESVVSPKVIMLVGPTGVGKTTTLAKLAARYAYLLDRPYKVALLNLDSYKVGASEQLEHYADIMQLEHISLSSVEEFGDRLKSMESEYDVVLVDTAGMSPFDTKKFLTTIEYIKTDFEHIDVHLVIPATIKYEDMSDIYENFSFLNLNSVIITKFDETKHFGTLLNFMLMYDIPMSYFCIGQEVPDDLIRADKEYLLERFIGDVSEG